MDLAHGGDRVMGHPAGEADEGIALRSTRALLNTLDRNPDDYRDVRATPRR